jgi:hypothetical protein
LLHQVGDLFELNVKFRCRKINLLRETLAALALKFNLLTENFAFPNFTLLTESKFNKNI